MLFFFELFLFVLVMLTLALGEFVSRGLALTLWLVVTVFALVGYVLARQSLRSNLTPPANPGDPTPPAPRSGYQVRGPSASTVHGEDTWGEGSTPAGEAPDVSSLDEKWARTLLYNWRRTNALLLLGALAVGAWYWLAGG